MEYYNPLCNFARGLVSDEVLSEDLVQDVFFHLWKNNETLELKAKMKSFLFTAVKNKAYEHHRANKAYKAALSGYKTDSDGNGATADMSSESTKYMRMERISSLLRHLPTKCRNVFALHKLKGLTYAEIAAKEGISIKTVENHMLKALKILRTKYSTAE